MSSAVAPEMMTGAILGKRSPSGPHSHATKRLQTSHADPLSSTPTSQVLWTWSPTQHTKTNTALLTCLTVGHVVDPQSTHIVLATHTNQLLVLDATGQLHTTLDTSQDAIQCLGAAPVSRLPSPTVTIHRRRSKSSKRQQTRGSSQGSKSVEHEPSEEGTVRTNGLGPCLDEVIVGDSRGTLAVYTNFHLLTHKELGTSPITTVGFMPPFWPTTPQAHLTLNPTHQILLGDQSGTLTCTSAQQMNWRLAFTQLTQRLLSQEPTPGLMSSLSGLGNSISAHSPVRCILPVLWALPDGSTAPYCFVITDQTLVYVLSHQTLVTIIHLPCQPRSLAKGHFCLPFQAPAQSQDSPNSSLRDSSADQVLVGCEDGSVYQITNQLTLSLLFVCDYSLTQLAVYRPRKPQSPTAKAEEPDWIICIGHCNQLFVYRAQQCLLCIPLDDWASEMAVYDIDDDGQQEIIILEGTQSVKVLRILP
ncbi:hypothetical protein IWQ62_003650 [Dispira parvispora]|uniref:Uncharacterized protein n=1 Tax=Dispira parvispora TaxID=1520584 RepID=A0A9W8ARD2_9FUNG|nr:hypothetical protein IWQ62_003650 [Dispira parvispora]